MLCCLYLSKDVLLTLIPTWPAFHSLPSRIKPNQPVYLMLATRNYSKTNTSKENCSARQQWLIPVILATWKGWNQEAQGSRTAQENSLWDPPIFKISRGKWTRDVLQGVESLSCKHEALSSNLIPPQKMFREGNCQIPNGVTCKSK
jgi:hypothetical protein